MRTNTTRGRHFHTRCNATKWTGILNRGKGDTHLKRILVSPHARCFASSDAKQRTGGYSSRGPRRGMRQDRSPFLGKKNERLTFSLIQCERPGHHEPLESIARGQRPMDTGASDARTASCNLIAARDLADVFLALTLACSACQYTELCKSPVTRTLTLSPF